ncbi:MAG: hypothetical protein PHC94_03450 [Methylobacter sp.]|nr:hypothetical protein [Methylobacter sp.]
MIISSTSSAATETNANLESELLNKTCQCVYLNHKALCDELTKWGSSELCHEIADQRAHLFAEAAVFVTSDNLCKQKAIITAVEKVIALPVYKELVLAYAPHTARFTPNAHGVFFGYDFHLSPSGPKLIEINTNAGGALLSAIMESSKKNCLHSHSESNKNNHPEQLFLKMFAAEWETEKRSYPLSCIAIIDTTPQQQYLFPEFLLFKHLFEQQGLKVVICDPSELSFKSNRLWLDQQPIDLVYNRLTDFSLEAPEHQDLLNAYTAGAVVVTPHPLSHALYADKRNLSILTNESMLKALGLDDATKATLLSGIAHTVIVNSADANTLWHNRKQLFFKPAKGYGSKAAYRGDKLTHRVFDEIIQNDYVAQTLVPPSKRYLQINDETAEFKFDLRMYVYQGETQLTIARLYQGQTTNFRTPGGGFAPIVEVV